MEKLLCVDDEAAELRGTTARFPRHLRRPTWSGKALTGADYTHVLFASVKEGTPAGAQYEAAKQVALERAGTGCGQTFSTSTNDTAPDGA